MVKRMRKREAGRKRMKARAVYWAKRLKVAPKVIRVQRMTRKWGSCSSGGIVTLAEDLAEQDRAFQDFVIAHELLHLRVQNHGKLFKALMSLHVPGWQAQNLERMHKNAHMRKLGRRLAEERAA
jgi:predicted metal-dependent hydrolase